MGCFWSFGQIIVDYECMRNSCGNKFQFRVSPFERKDRGDLSREDKYLCWADSRHVVGSHQLCSKVVLLPLDSIWRRTADFYVSEWVESWIGQPTGEWERERSIQKLGVRIMGTGPAPSILLLSSKLPKVAVVRPNGWLLCTCSPTMFVYSAAFYPRRDCGRRMGKCPKWKQLSRCFCYCCLDSGLNCVLVIASESESEVMLLFGQISCWFWNLWPEHHIPLLLDNDCQENRHKVRGAKNDTNFMAI